MIYYQKYNSKYIYIRAVEKSKVTRPYGFHHFMVHLFHDSLAPWFPDSLLISSFEFRISPLTLAP